MVNDVSARRFNLTARKEQGKLTREDAEKELTICDEESRRAQTHASHAIELDSVNRVAWVQLGRAQYYLEDYKAAQNTVRHATELFPEDSDLIPLKALIDKNLNKPMP